MDEIFECPRCRRHLPRSEFQHRRAGFLNRRAECKRCAAQHARKVRLVRNTYAERLAAQGGTCAMCGGSPNGRSLEIDIDWRRIWEPGTRCFRGLLCNRCNTIAGYCDDDISRLLEAIQYLGGGGYLYQAPLFRG